ncbi:MAG: VWA domain-containing protein [Spirochaetaceae bacterium]|nr:MAG: VWA domain-containing protein [Spirochaetaceae bacterium]
MTFLYPQYLWFLLALPLLGVLLLFSVLRGRSAIATLVGGYARNDVMNILTIKSFVVTVLFSVALSSLIVAIAGPRWGEVSVEDERRGMEIVFLVDISNSMLVDDIAPSRLGRSREVIRAVAARLPEAHHAIVVFKGGASVLVPMTDDPAAFELAVSNLSPALVTAPGTELSGGLALAAETFPGGTPRHPVIVLFSDGGHEEGISGRVVERLRDASIPVYAVIAGTPAGGTIPTTDGGVLRDSAGDPVIVGIMEERMRRLAEATGGELYYLSEGTTGNRLAGDLEQIGGAGAGVLFRQVSVDRYHLFVLLALFLLTVMLLIQNIRWKGLV